MVDDISSESVSINELQNIIIGRPEIIERDKNAIIAEVERSGCTYATEISRNTLVPKERAVQLIYVLIKENKIFRLALNPNVVPMELLPKMQHYWSMGIHGYNMFNSITWVLPKPQIPYTDYMEKFKIPVKDIIEEQSVI